MEKSFKKFMEDGKVRKIEQFAHLVKISQGLRKSKISFRKGCEKFATLWKFCRACEKFAHPLLPYEIPCEIKKGVWTQFATQKSILQAHVNSNIHAKNQRSSKNLFKALQTLNPFRTPHLLLAKPSTILRHQSFHRLSLHWTPRDQPFEEATYTSHSISNMTLIREGHTDLSLSHEPRLRASSPRDSTFQAPEAPTVPSS